MFSLSNDCCPKGKDSPSDMQKKKQQDTHHQSNSIQQLFRFLQYLCSAKITNALNFSANVNINPHASKNAVIGPEAKQKPTFEF
jgi:hypothetical protein